VNTRRVTVLTVKVPLRACLNVTSAPRTSDVVADFLVDVIARTREASKLGHGGVAGSLLEPDARPTGLGAD